MSGTNFKDSLTNKGFVVEQREDLACHEAINTSSSEQALCQMVQCTTKHERGRILERCKKSNHKYEQQSRWCICRYFSTSYTFYGFLSQRLSFNAEGCWRRNGKCHQTNAFEQMGVSTKTISNSIKSHLQNTKIIRMKIGSISRNNFQLEMEIKNWKKRKFWCFFFV